MSYSDDHPTSFYWRPDVRRLINKYQAMFPYQTYANTYRWHPPYNPPYITRRYDAVSVDFWGGGLDAQGRYTGYRGKTLPKALGHKLFDAIFDDPELPRIYWIIWDYDMWVAGSGWEPAPWGPADSDPNHLRHIHVTFQ